MERERESTSVRIELNKLTHGQGSLIIETSDNTVGGSLESGISFLRLFHPVNTFFFIIY